MKILLFPQQQLTSSLTKHWAIVGPVLDPKLFEILMVILKKKFREKKFDESKL